MAGDSVTRACERTPVGTWKTLLREHGMHGSACHGRAQSPRRYRTSPPKPMWTFNCQGNSVRSGPSGGDGLSSGVSSLYEGLRPSCWSRD